VRCVRVDRIEAFRQASPIMLRNELRDGIGEEFTARNAKAMRERLRRFEKGVRKRNSGLHAARITKVIPLCKSAERELDSPTWLHPATCFAPLHAKLRSGDARASRCQTTESITTTKHPRAASTVYLNPRLHMRHTDI